MYVISYNKIYKSFIVSSPEILMSTAKLAFSCGYTVSVVIWRLIINIRVSRLNTLVNCDPCVINRLCFFVFKLLLSIIKVILGSHAVISIICCSRSYRSFTTTGCLRSSSLLIIKIIKVIKHQIHVFLLFFLQVMDDALIFVDFNSDMSISLPRYGSWFD